MRLIDADTLLNKLQDPQMYVTRKIIENAPTIDLNELCSSKIEFLVELFRATTKKPNDKCGEAELLGEYDSGYSDGFTDGTKICEIFNPIQHKNKAEPVKHAR